MKQITIQVLLVSALFLNGCRIVKDVPTKKKLIEFNCSENNKEVSTNFICPEKGIGFTLVFDDGRGDKRDFCSHPDWPLYIILEVYEPEDKQPAYKSEYDKNKMVFTSWHNNSTSVLLEDNSVFKQLSPNKEYKISLQIIKSDPNLGVSSLYIHWFESKKINLI